MFPLASHHNDFQALLQRGICTYKTGSRQPGQITYMLRKPIHYLAEQCPRSGELEPTSGISKSIACHHMHGESREPAPCQSLAARRSYTGLSEGLDHSLEHQ